MICLNSLINIIIILIELLMFVCLLISFLKFLLSNMCLNPLKIRNNKLDLSIANDRQFVTVPCGHCAHCIQKKILSWKNRLYIEYRDTKLKGHSSFMVTLTYNEDHVPTYDGHYCTSKRDVQLFLKRFRKITGWKFKYIITSEFGHLHDRIHYHGCFFMQDKINPSLFFEKLESAWQNGFVCIGKNKFDKREIESVAALGYVSKYICKDSFTYCKSLYPKDIYRKYFKNFILASNGIGLSLLDTSLFDVTTGTMSVPSKNGYINVPLPLYFIRKLYYDCYRNENGNISYKLNDTGITHKLYNFNRLVQNKVDVVTSYVSTNHNYLLNLLNQSNVNPNTVNQKIISSLQNPYFVKNFFIYKEVFEDRFIVEPFLYDTLRYDYLSDDFIYDYLSYYKLFLSRSTCSDDYNNTLYNSLPQFRYFELVSPIVQLINNCIAYDNLTKKIDKYNTVQTLRYNSGEFHQLKLEEIPDFDLFNNLLKT